MVLYNSLLGEIMGCISQVYLSKSKSKVWLEFELAYYDVKMQHVSHNLTGNSCVV